MKTTRIVLTALMIGWLAAGLEVTAGAALGQDASPPPLPTTPGGAQSVLQQAIIAVESLSSVSAQVRHRADLLGNQLVGVGSYCEQRGAKGLELRLELVFQLGENNKSTLTQVCSGQYLWICRDKDPPRRIDLARVYKEVGEKGGFARPGKIGNWPGLGGLPRLLRGLNANFDFTLIEETRLDGQLPAYRLQGDWRQEKLSKTPPGPQGSPRAGTPVDLDRLPQHLPHYVVLYLEKQGLFLRRIEYWRRPPAKAREQGTQKDRAIVSMDLFDVVLNAPINPTRFQFDPGDAKPIDQTNAFLEELRLKE
jgi:hypothetical protein